MKIPVIILSYNRPMYLEKVLLSMREQDKVLNTVFSFFLFQDVPPFELQHEDSSVDECINIFRTVLNEGEVFKAPKHQGIALNYNRAEHFVFNELKSQIAFFFEDDMILNRNYFQILTNLSKLALANNNIGTVTAAGCSHKTSYEEQVNKRELLQNAGFSWGFALTKKHWEERKPYLDEYISIIKNNRYKYRDTQKIWHFYSKLGFGKHPTSQDRVKTLVTNYLKRLRLSTTTVNARYIGKLGEHFTKDIFNARGFEKQVVFEDYYNIDFQINTTETRKLLQDESLKLQTFQSQNSYNGLTKNVLKKEKVNFEKFSLPKRLILKAPIESGNIKVNRFSSIFNFKDNISELKIEFKSSPINLKLFLIIIYQDNGDEFYKEITSSMPTSVKLDENRNIQVLFVNKSDKKGIIERMTVSY